MQPRRQAGFAQGLVIIMIGILPMMAIVTLIPIVPAIMRAFPNVSGIETMAPMVLAAPGLCVALFSPFAGALTDKLGRRKLLLIFTTLYGIGGVLPFFITSFEALMAGRLLLGVGEAFILTIGNALLGDYFDKEQRAKWLVLQNFIGPALAVGLITASGRLSMIAWNVPFLIYAAALGFAAFAFFTVYEPERRVEAESGPGAATGEAPASFPTRLMATIVGTTVVLSAISFIHTLQFSLALDQMGIKKGSDIGIYSALVGVGGPLGSLMYKWLAPRSAPVQFTVLLMLLGIGLTGVGLAFSLPVTMAFAFVEQVGSGMIIAVLVGWSLRELPESHRGRGMGWWCSAYFLGQFVSPMLVGAGRAVFGGLIETFFAVGVACVAAAVVTGVLGARRR